VVRRRAGGQYLLLIDATGAACEHRPAIDANRRGSTLDRRSNMDKVKHGKDLLARSWRWRMASWRWRLASWRWDIAASWRWNAAASWRWNVAASWRWD
jgi:hypothetical protein